MAQRIARLERSFILPPSLAVRKRVEPSGNPSRPELARFYTVLNSAAQNNLKGDAGWPGPATLYIRPVPGATKTCLQFLMWAQN
jgi:hypothetical protein